MQKILALLITFFVGMLSVVSAQPQDDLENASLDKKEEIENLIQATYAADPSTFLFKSLDAPVDGEGFRVLFVYEGKRYTLDHDWFMEGIRIWVRPEEDRHVVLADALGDINADGRVNYGTNGDDKVFNAPGAFGPSHEGSGEQHRPYWQDVYEEALRGWQAALQSP